MRVAAGVGPAGPQGDELIVWRGIVLIEGGTQRIYSILPASFTRTSGHICTANYQATDFAAGTANAWVDAPGVLAVRLDGGVSGLEPVGVVIVAPTGLPPYDPDP